MKHLRPPSPKRPVAETASPKCPRPVYWGYVCSQTIATPRHKFSG